MRRFLIFYSLAITVFLGGLGYLAALGSSLGGGATGNTTGGATGNTTGGSTASLEAATEVLRQRYSAAETEAERQSIRQVSSLLDAAAAQYSSRDFSRATLARGLLAFTLFTGAMALITLGILWFFLMRKVANPLARLSRSLSADLSASLPQKVPESGISDVRNLCAAFNALCGKLAEYKDQVQAAERETVGRYLVHEIKNLLTPIPLALSVLRPSGSAADRPDEEAAALALIENQARDIGSLLERFRQSYRFPEMNKAPCELLTLVKALPQARDSRVTVDGKSGTIVPGDLRFLSQAIGNLVANALDACSEKPDNGTVRITVSEAKDRAVVEIRDTGAGMSQEALDKVFAEWFTTKQKGMGLGLPFSLRVAKAHGGDITFISQRGEGTTCTMALAK